jgi:glycosyltransferase involved in cell wall biosynthesis
VTGTRPTVGVVVPTHDRPELLRLTLDSILDQDTDAELEIVVVFDRSTPDVGLEELTRPGRRVRVLANERSAGLAGSRNTGVLALDTDWVAFCDDDDTWAADRLSAQLERSRQFPAADVFTTSISVAYEGTEVARLAGTDEVTHADLTRSRMSMLHSSTLLLRASALRGWLGLIDETIPGSQNEDWDILLRAAERAPIQHIDRPLVRVLWGASSHFSRRWETRVSSLEWMLERHPAISDDDRGSARVFGQLAFGSAALGRTRDARRWARSALLRRWTEPRAYLALAVTGHLVSADTVMGLLHRRGRGV